MLSRLTPAESTLSGFTPAIEAWDLTTTRGTEEGDILHQGQRRFDRGLVAFPDFTEYREARVHLGTVEYCPVCARPREAQLHKVGDACPEIKRLVRASLVKTPLIDTPSRLANRRRRARRAWRIRQRKEIGLSSGAARPSSGEKFAEGKRGAGGREEEDRYRCCHSESEIREFERNPFKLAKHLYHVDATKMDCSYCLGFSQEHRGTYRMMLGRERYERGFMAFPDALFSSSCGYTVFDTVPKCIVCGVRAPYDHWQYLQQDHLPGCKDMMRVLRWTLDTFGEI